MAAQKLYGVPPKVTLPLVKGEDVDVTFVYRPALLDPNGEVVLGLDDKPIYEEDDFPEGAQVTLIIEPAVTGVAVIDGSRAQVNIDHALVDRVRPGTLWRLVLRVSELDRVLINGTTTRSDGQ